MSARLLEQLSVKQKGHWGLIYDCSQEVQQSSVLEEIASTFRGSLLAVDCGALPQDRDALQIELRDKLKAFLTDVRAGQKRCAYCILRDFHKLSTQQQIDALITARGLREDSSNGPLATIAAGSWNQYRVHAEWPTHISSPCPDESRIHRLRPATANDFSQYLVDDGWLSKQPSEPELDGVVVSALLELTGADLVLLQELLAAMRTSNRGLLSFQTSIEGTCQSEAVVGIVEERLTSVEPEARKLFAEILSRQVVMLSAGQTKDAEDLRLAGLITIDRTPDTAAAVIRSPIIERIFRSNGHLLAGFEIKNDTDFVAPSISINTHAYRLVVQIETLLRNAMVEILSENADESWQQEAAVVKIPDNSPEENAEAMRELKLLLSNAAPMLGLDVNERSSSDGTLDGAAPKKVAVKSKMTTVLAAAVDWRRRMQDKAVVFPYEQSLAQFVTVGSLEMIYLKTGRCDALLQRCFTSRQEAIAFFHKFGALRSAVAHNFSLGITAVRDLLILKRDLGSRLGRSSLK